MAYFTAIMRADRRRKVVGTVCVAAALTVLAFDGANGAGQQGSTSDAAAPRAGRAVRVTVGKSSFLVDLNDSQTARDFAARLPLTFDMHDLFGREKVGHLQEPLAGGNAEHQYRVGQLVYWSPGPDVAFYYRQDGERIPDPGVLPIGDARGSVKALDVKGTVKVMIDKE